MRFVVERRPSTGTPANATVADAYLRPVLYQMPDKLIPLSGVIRELAEREGRGSETRAAKVRAFYEYVYRTMSYDKSGTGWGRGDAVWACENKRGNCTDFHSLFIGMLRSQGIPARFLIGFPVPDAEAGAIPGYHCWAEFLDEKRGWIPVDASEAKKKEMPDAYFGTIPNDRIEFTAGRDIVLSPPQHGEALNYFVYPYAEAQGKPSSRRIPSPAFGEWRRTKRPGSTRCRGDGRRPGLRRRSRTHERLQPCLCALLPGHGAPRSSLAVRRASRCGPSADSRREPRDGGERAAPRVPRDPMRAPGARHRHHAHLKWPQ